MTSEEIEQVVWEYLKKGDGNRIAGTPKSTYGCPVGNALYLHDGFSSRVHRLAIDRRDAFLEMTPRVEVFIALVDNEPGDEVTFSRCRELWRQAKDG